MKYFYDDFMNLKVKNRSNLYVFGFTRCEEDKCWRLIVKTGVKTQEDYADSYSFVISIYDEDYNLFEKIPTTIIAKNKDEIRIFGKNFFA